MEVLYPDTQCRENTEITERAEPSPSLPAARVVVQQSCTLALGTMAFRRALGGAVRDSGDQEAFSSVLLITGKGFERASRIGLFNNGYRTGATDRVSTT